MWLLGLISAGIITFANIFLKSYSLIVLLVISIILSFKFKDLYLKYVKEKVNKIKRENTDKSKQELMIICSKKGGTSLLPVIALIIIYGISLYINLIVTSNLINKSKDDNNNKYETSNKLTTLIDLNVTIPDNFKRIDFINNKSVTYILKESEDYSYDCSLRLSIEDTSFYNNDAKLYLENETSYYSSLFSGITEKNINNNTWYYGYIINNSTQKYHYATFYNGNIYGIKYVIRNIKNENCSNAHKTIKNSLKFN